MALEKLQKRAAKFVTGKYETPYCNLVKEVDWLSLHQRRSFSKNVLCYKIVNGLIDLPFDEYFKYRNVTCLPSLRSVHNKQICEKYARTDVCKYSCFYNIIKHWNTLPLDIVSSESIFTFKNRLKKYYGNYNHSECNICSTL